MKENITNENEITQHGWLKEKNGFLTTTRTTQVFTSPEFNNFSESSRARWDLQEYLKVKFSKLLQRRHKS
jgi:hypothetical protein